MTWAGLGWVELSKVGEDDLLFPLLLLQIGGGLLEGRTEGRKERKKGVSPLLKLFGKCFK